MKTWGRNDGISVWKEKEKIKGWKKKKQWRGDETRINCKSSERREILSYQEKHIKEEKQMKDKGISSLVRDKKQSRYDNEEGEKILQGNQPLNKKGSMWLTRRGIEFIWGSKRKERKKNQ